MTTTHQHPKTLGGFLQMVARASAVPMAGPAGAGETIDSDGGFLIPPDFSESLVTRVYNTGQIAARCFRPLAPDGNRVFAPLVSESSRAAGSRFGGARSYWLAEGSDITPSAPKFGLAELPLNKLVCLAYASGEIMQDAPQLQANFERIAALELAHALETAIVSGSGAGKPLGLLNSPAKIAVTRAGASAVAAADVRNMAARLWGACWPGAVWLCNESVVGQLLALSGTLLTFYSGGMLLAGRPVLVSENCAALGTESDIVLTDLSQYLLVDKVSATVSIHIRFVQDEGAFRVVWRVAGQPLWDSALTPLNGSNSLSSIVSLAAA